MDEIVEYNKMRWEELARAGVMYSLPWLDLMTETAQDKINPYGHLGDVDGKRVLCLACGGGQQCAAFALLGCNVTIFDLSETQLSRSEDAARHYGYTIQTVQGDMQTDLARFADNDFDIVYQPYAINYVPDLESVFRQVARVVKPNGAYHIACHNPFVLGTGSDSWNGVGYIVHHLYENGAEVVMDDSVWEVESGGVTHRIATPRFFRHTLSGIVNGLVASGFIILGMYEEPKLCNFQAEPGTWTHYTHVLPPFLSFWTRKPLERA